MRRLLVALAVVVALIAAVPAIAFGVVPLFVRQTLVEPAPPSPSPAPADEAIGTPAPPPLVLAGGLRRIDAVHYGSGRVALTAAPGAARTLRFQDVDIAGAPNMFVYLSDVADGRPGRYVDLGALKATSGSFNYAVPDSVDLGSVRAVVVWCRAFSVTVTFAPLTPA